MWLGLSFDPFRHGNFFRMRAGFATATPAVRDAAQQRGIEIRTKIEAGVQIGVLHDTPSLVMRHASALWLI